MTTIDKNTHLIPQVTIPQEMSFWDAAAAKLNAIIVSVGLAISTLSTQTTIPPNYSTMASNAQEFVNTNILFSSTFPKRNNHFDANNSRSVTERLQGVNDGIGEIRDSIQGSSTFNRAIEMGMNALKYSIGNCMEMSAAAFVYLLQTHPEVKIDLYHIEKGDHCFLVIGRDFNSDPADPKTWGENALICDTWSKKTFPASEINKLKDFAGIIMTNGYPVLRDLDLSAQTLEIWTSNQYTLKDLEYIAGPQPKSYVVDMINTLAPLLQNFHQEKNLEKKQEAAKTIQKLLAETPFRQSSNPSVIAFQMARISLYDQLNFFINSNCTSL